jgi:hypothetical protein
LVVVETAEDKAVGEDESGDELGVGVGVKAGVGVGVEQAAGHTALS